MDGDILWRLPSSSPPFSPPLLHYPSPAFTYAFFGFLPKSNLQYVVHLLVYLSMSDVESK
ncbi:hypothetical protein E2C01_047951 [Portunus trituberculatus]|uniref:Uncharacterized protein n=1 Tax=Portunus trituberculatus TaxID=210409 RepID=A0A5B7GBX8_PORTR|nr:hypothetical protein [Portunus trituberculatus]